MDWLAEKILLFYIGIIMESLIFTLLAFITSVSSIAALSITAVILLVLGQLTTLVYRNISKQQ